MNPDGCPQCNSAQLRLGYPHPRYLVEGTLEVEASPRRAGYNTCLEACVCPSCGRVQLFSQRGGDAWPGLPPGSIQWGKAV